MKRHTLVLTLCSLCLALISCSSEPKWADPEAHARTEELNKLYAPQLCGTWHTQHMSQTRRIFEQLTFESDGTLTGYRKWHGRELVTVQGEKVFTDWEEITEMSGRFSGTWQLKHYDAVGDGKADYLIIHAEYDEEHFTVAYLSNLLFGEVNDTLLRIRGPYFTDDEGWTVYRRGASEPEF